MQEHIPTYEEASKILRLDPSQVRRLLRSGEIKGKKLARDWVVLELNYQRKRRPKGGIIMQFILKLKCPICGYLDEEVGHEAKSVWQARHTSLHCPHHEDVDMEVVEVASSKGEILWQDSTWLREEEQIAREIDSWGNTGQRRSKTEKKEKS